MQMTPRQRWLATLAGEPTDRQATDYWGTGEFGHKLRADVGCEGDALWRRLRVDVLHGVGPTRKAAGHPLDPQANMWGVRHTAVDYGTGAYNETVSHPLEKFATVAELDAFPWPSADDFDYSTIAAQIRDNPDRRLVRGGCYEPFLTYCEMRGREQSYMDLIENPEITEAILEHLFDFHYEWNRRIFEAAGRGNIDVFYLAEDLGGQHGPLFSLEVYRRFLMPGQRRMAELARSYGILIFYHTDGAARIFVPDLIENVGIDILNPLQWRCPGMELPELVRDFGRHVAFHGGIDNQQTLPFGTVDEVRRQVRWCAQVMRRHGGRWICAPCHNIQAITPVANVLAMYDEASHLECAVAGS